MIADGLPIAIATEPQPSGGGATPFRVVTSRMAFLGSRMIYMRRLLMPGVGSRLRKHSIIGNGW